MSCRRKWLVFIPTCYIIYLLTGNKSYLTRLLMKSQKNYQKERNSIILLYTTWNVEEFWSDLYPEQLENYLKKINCSVKDCQITYDRSKLPEASAVLFHAQDLASDDIYSPENLLMLQRPAHQRWVWVNQESPLNLKNVHLYNGVFNWTATYHRNSDIFLPYGSYIKQQGEVKITEHKVFSERLMRQKKRLIAWAVSDCGGLREQYVWKLQEFLNITVFGKCKDRYKQSGICYKDTRECRNHLSQYKFYLSFENSVCEDYVTEKYWSNALSHNSVPIVFGANYDSNVVIPGSFINIKDFGTVADLAKYIKFLDKHDDYYIKYFAWKRKYKEVPVEDLMCLVCEKLHNSKNVYKVYDDLDQFWSKERHCSNYDYVNHKVKIAVFS